MPIYQLSEELWFPPPEDFEQHGVVAIGGDLNIERLILAYKLGIFPWYNEDEPPLWWSPEQRMVMKPGEMKISKSLRNILNRNLFEIKADTAFEQVIGHCQNIKRPGQEGTWLNDEMKQAYIHLHHLGIAHSIECWQNNELVGGLYGVSLGRIFCGESMFSLASNASKVAFAKLNQKLLELNFELIDCQVHNPFLESLGAYEIPREEFLDIIDRNDVSETLKGSWTNFFIKNNPQ